MSTITVTDFIVTWIKSQPSCCFLGTYGFHLNQTSKPSTNFLNSAFPNSDCEDRKNQHFQAVL